MAEIYDGATRVDGENSTLHDSYISITASEVSEQDNGGVNFS
jgi:hypothetical protein